MSCSVAARAVCILLSTFPHDLGMEAIKPVAGRGGRRRSKEIRRGDIVEIANGLKVGTFVGRECQEEPITVLG